MKRLPIIILAFISTAVYAQHTDSIRAIVDREAAGFMQSSNAVGLAVGIYQSGTTHTYSYGVADRETGSKTSPGSIFNIASLSKTFTGQLLAIAQVERKLSMEDDVRKYLDGSYPNLEYNGQPIRLIHLVSHVSRLPFHLSGRAEEKDYSRDEFYNDLHNAKIDTLPGVRFLYSTAGSQLLGYVLEKVYHQSYEKLIATKIARPLGMKHTKITLTKDDLKLVTKGYDEKGVTDLRSYDYLQGAGGVRSTADDLVKYIGLQIKEADEATRLAHKEVWGFDMGNGNHYSFGLGWQIIKMQGGKRRISQDGNLPGYSSVIVFCPEIQTGIVILTNSFMIDKIGDLANAILKAINPGMP
jgi:D-alanyl-D-alanine-carboxypeptidase/D-alanyl-D-alanine-endopeptidase